MLHIERLGKGRNVILLHGFLESSTMWSYIDWLGVRQIRIDLPGHGKSPHVDCEDIVSMAELVNRSLSPDERREPIIVGHSMGGYVALELIKYFENPRLILINSNFWKDSEIEFVSPRSLSITKMHLLLKRSQISSLSHLCILKI